jgi:hypothetical protein
MEALTQRTKEVKMSPFMEKNPTQFFAVVGAAYVPEHHLDTYSRCERSPSKKFIWLPGDADEAATTQTLELR